MTDQPLPIGDAQLAEIRRAGLRQRPEDQPLPIGNDRPGAHDVLIDQLRERRELGLRRYGQLLQPHNGRDTGRDLVEELLDGAVYAQTLAVELADLRDLEQRARSLVAFWRQVKSPAVRQAAADLEAALDDTVPVPAQAVVDSDLETMLLRLVTVWTMEPGEEKLEAMRQAMTAAGELLTSRRVPF